MDIRLNDLVDNIFVINLKESTDRLKSITEQAHRLGFVFERVEPVPSSNFDVKATKDNGWNNNAMSLLHTTIGILKTAKKRGYKRIMILEDDAIFQDEFYNGFLSDLMTFNTDVGNYDFLHLFWSHSTRFSLGMNSNFRLTKDGCLGCLAYIVNEPIFDLYIKILERQSQPIDHYVAQLQYHRRRSFLYQKKVVTHPPYRYSTLRETIVDY